MSILGRFARKRTASINDNYRITQVGEEKLTSAFDGDIRSTVLSILQSNGTLSIKEVSQRANISPAKAEKVLLYLEHNNFVQNISNTNSMMGDD